MIRCPYCAKQPDHVIDNRTITGCGSFYRTSDSKRIKRWRCLKCRRTFSQATEDPCFMQKKRQKNRFVFDLLASCVSMRRTARLLRLSRTTIARKLEFLGLQARNQLYFDTAFHGVARMQFDDLETFEHTKLKPLSIIMAVEEKTRRVLGIRVARMGAKGRLVHKSLAKYGKLPEERSRARASLFRELRAVVQRGATIRSDSNPYYLQDVKRYFPDAHHFTCVGQRGAITGGGELKKIGFDPLFSLNNTFACFRANVARLVRKTWCTTKRKSRLEDHLAIFAVYHNSHLKAVA